VLLPKVGLDEGRRVSVVEEEERLKGIPKLTRCCPNQHQSVLLIGECIDMEGRMAILAIGRGRGKLRQSYDELSESPLGGWVRQLQCVVGWPQQDQGRVLLRESSMTSSWRVVGMRPMASRRYSRCERDRYQRIGARRYVSTWKGW
jgi:hypothetical protein